MNFGDGTEKVGRDQFHAAAQRRRRAALVAGLAACGGDDEDTAGTTTGAGAALASTLRFSNWQLYIDVDDEDENLRPTLAAFTAETGVKVDYVEDINDNSTFYAKIAPQLEAGQASGRDLVVLTDWMAARMIREGLVQPMD